MAEEELHCINIDDVANLEDIPRLVCIDEECGNLIVVNYGEELTGNISQKKKLDIFNSLYYYHYYYHIFLVFSIYSVVSKIYKCENKDITNSPRAVHMCDTLTRK